MRWPRALQRLAGTVLIVVAVSRAPLLAAEPADVDTKPDPVEAAPGGIGSAWPSDAPVSWKQVGADAHYLFARPAHLDRMGWTKLAVALGVGAALYLVRDDVRDYAQRHRDGSVDQLLNDARLMGRTATPLLAAGAFYISGKARDSQFDKETASLILENLAFASAITGVSQRVLATERPRHGDDIDLFSPAGGHSVSGDVTVAASMLAPVIDRHLQVDADDGRGVRFWKHFGAVGLYGMAGLVAAQRVNANAHWLPDVYLGYLNGLCVGRILVDSRRGGRAWREERKAHRVEVQSSLSGLRITWR